MEERLRQCLSDWLDAEIAEAARLDNLGGHASLRIYWRVHLPQDLSPPRRYPRGETTLMAMVLPEGQDPLASAEGESSDAPRPAELPFVNVQRYLADIGMPVPSIDHVDMERGVLILEDLGDRLFEHAVLEAEGSEGRLRRYREAIDLLIRFQVAVEGDEGRECVAFDRWFDGELLRWELEHYREWGLQAQHGEEATAGVDRRLDEIFEGIVEELVEAPQTLSLRDYQSRNIMEKKGSWIMIDFQDALMGPVVYDLVALLRDSYIELDAREVSTLLDYYVEAGAAAGLGWCADGDQVRRLFHVQTVQRKLKDAGRFIYIDQVKGNPSFLDYYGPSIGYVREALGALEDDSGLVEVLREVEPAF